MKRITSLVLLLLLSLAARRVQADSVLIKIATLAPDGTSWMKLFREWQKKVEERTEGRVRIKFYASGIMGDEKDVMRKIRLGQLSGAAISIIGLVALDPYMRALALPRTYEELDALRTALEPTLRKRLLDKGFVLG